MSTSSEQGNLIKAKNIVSKPSNIPKYFDNSVQNVDLNQLFTNRFVQTQSATPPLSPLRGPFRIFNLF